jgi:hypothetical protein
MMFDLLVPERSARLVYLHGSIADRHSIVLSDRDYTRQYLRSDSTVRKLFAIFAMQRIVFFGFSLRDPDLTFIMRQVAGALGYENARHFAFVGIKPGEPREADRKRLRQKFGIDAIFYDKTNDHQRLKFLMAQLLRECGCEPPASLGSPPPPPAPPSRGANVDEPPGLAAAGARNRRPTKLRSNPRIPDDPRKGMFGGQAVARGRRLSATVEQVDGRRDWFTVMLRVSTENDAPPLKGKVKFYLHHTFDQPVVDVTAQNGEATLTATCYGAFTVGAVADGGKTELELDLATLEAPRRFLEN